MEKFIYEQVSPEVTIGVYIQPPQKRTIFFGDEFLNEKYFIPLPHVAFINNFTGVTERQVMPRMAFLDSGELTDDSILYIPYLPNVTSLLKFCLGNASIRSRPFDKAISNEMMLKIADMTWNSTFTTGYLGGVISYCDATGDHSLKSSLETGHNVFKTRKMVAEKILEFIENKPLDWNPVSILIESINWRDLKKKIKEEFRRCL